MEMKRKLSNNCILLNQGKKKNFVAQTGFTNYYNSVPRLESIAIVQVVTALCKQPDVRDAVMQGSSNIPKEETDPCSYIYYKPIVKNILNKLSLLPLPNLAKAKMSPVIKPIVMQIFKFLHSINTHIGHDNLDSIGYSTSNYLYWTSQGIVDRAKTLKRLIEANYDSGLLECKKTAQYIYELACTYCLEDNIPILWEKLTEETKDHYLNRRLYKNVEDKHLIAYWSSVNNNELSRLSRKIGSDFYIYNWKHSIYKNMVSLALNQGNILAVKYFWDKLLAEEIICNLTRWVKEVIKYVNYEIHEDDYNYYLNTNEYADILYFLLSKVSAETQREVIQKNSHVVLQSLFLYWPYQRCLLPAVQTVWDSLDKKVYLDLLYAVAKEVRKDKTSQTILKELCRKSPINLKQCLIHDILNDNTDDDDLTDDDTDLIFRDRACFVLCYLLVLEDVKTVKEIISYANYEEKKEVAEKVTEFYFGDIEINEASLDVVDQFLQETSLSELEIISLKEKVGLKFVTWLCGDWLRQNNWQMVEHFLNWAFKNNVMEEQEKINMTFEFLKEDNYEFVNRFMNWCFCSQQEIDEFKKKFALNKPEIVEVGEDDWSLFEKFIAWSSLSEQEINQFKRNVLQSKELKSSIGICIQNEQTVKFIDKFLNWCCHSNEEVQLYKKVFVCYQLSIPLFDQASSVEVNETFEINSDEEGQL